MRPTEIFTVVTSEMVEAGLEAMRDARRTRQSEAQMVCDIFIAMYSNGISNHCESTATLH